MRYTRRVDSGEAAEAYTRHEIRRILGISENSLRAWERAGLAEAKATYTFADLISLKTLESLRAKQISARQIREAVHQIRLRLVTVARPLDELKIVTDGRRIAVEMPGERMEALTGQMLFNFDAQTMKSVATLELDPADKAVPSDREGTESWFQYALEMEGSGAEPQDIIAVYRRVLECDPMAAGAWVNMGTLHYQQRRLALAEKCYHKALQAYPDYALAHFNLANVYDETGRIEDAATHYETALKLQPDYADAHYNLALVQERRERWQEAARHWQAYLDFDPSSPWADIARRKRASLLRVAIGGPGGRFNGRPSRKPGAESSD